MDKRNSQDSNANLNSVHKLILTTGANVTSRFGFWCAVTTLVSAFLVFQIQPVISKAILPWFGGGPAVWTTCLVFFQVALLAGYGYAHFLAKWFPSPVQAGIHFCLIVCALVFLPIAPSDSWKPVDGSDPTFRIIALLIANVGAPYLLLSATSPLLQAWYARRYPGRIPYRLYALSNVGSLGALLTYPFIVEPLLGVRSQSLIWSLGFVCFAVLTTLLAMGVQATRNVKSGDDSREPDRAEAMAKPAAPVSWPSWFHWVALSAFGSLTLLAITNQVCQEIAVVPLLWIVPLSLYLITFIIAFERSEWYAPRWWGLFAGLVVLATIFRRCSSWTFVDGFFKMVQIDMGIFYDSILIEISLYFASLFAICMICHGELVRRKPAPKYLTSFYFALATGGAMGGLFAAIVCPAIFPGLYEMDGILFTAMAFSLLLFFQDGIRKWQIPKSIIVSVAALLGISLLYLAAIDGFQSRDPDILVQRRNFYGIMAVKKKMVGDEPGRAFYHGRTLHGFQYTSEARRRNPTTYYVEESGVGLAIKQLGVNGPLRVGAVGLGVGTIASYGRPGDHYHFYEINSAVAEIANTEFTYLADSEAEIEISIGDARILIEREQDRKYDLLILDAFSGDAIPVHLLTREAFVAYRPRLAENGVIAVHVSNRYLDLIPVVAAAANQQNFHAVSISAGGGETIADAASTWVLLTRDLTFLESPTIFDNIEPWNPSGRTVEWTDQFSNLLNVFLD